jgi:SAM-dependent methyltransferase
MTADFTEQKREAVDTHSRQADQFDARYQDLRRRAYESCFTYSRVRLEEWLDRLVPSATQAARALDIGCGTGHHLALLGRKGFSVFGVDGSMDMVGHAHRNNPTVGLGLADVDTLPFSSGEFDLTLSIEVLRYLPDVPRAVREMARVLRPGATCIVTASPLLSLNGYWLVNRLATSMPLPRFVRLKQFFLTSWHLRRIFVEEGFRDVEIHGVYLGPVNWIERLAPRALPTLLRRWEPWDASLSDWKLLKEMSNMFVLRATRI